MRRANNVLGLIGATPVVRLHRVVGDGGANAHRAVEAAADTGPDQEVVTILCDPGLRYLSTRVFE